MIEAGAKAPDFSLPDHDGNEVSLADFVEGRWLLLGAGRRHRHLVICEAG